MEEENRRGKVKGENNIAPPGQERVESLCWCFMFPQSNFELIRNLEAKKILYLVEISIFCAKFLKTCCGIFFVFEATKQSWVTAKRRKKYLQSP